MMAPILSVIIVAYRSINEMRGNLSSLPRTLSRRPVEVIVVDNSCSHDGLDRLVAAEFPWVIYLNPAENLGFGRANNRGYSLCRGDYVVYLNPDTISNSEAFEHCLQRLSADSEIGLISPRLELADGSMDLACRRSIPTMWDGFCRASGLAGAFPNVRLFAGYNLTYLPKDGTYDVSAINGAFMMGRKSVLDHMGGFDEQFFMYGDDLDLCIRVRKAGYRIVYDGSHAIVHLKGLSVGKDFDRMSTAIFDANRDVYLKHFNPNGSRWIRWKYQVTFGLWKRVARLRAWLRGSRRVRPV
ncbi:MAG TPA: glycosyltransferase family 2 protein [Opitutaceae bacterium]|nr:glycosyltransferase family 2 protein [Opitutaceae bacterium]